MTRFVQPLVFVIFILGLTTNAELACSPETTSYDWPGFLLIGLAGVLAVCLWGPKVWGAERPSLMCVGTFAVFALWIAARGFVSPVSYFARGDLALLGVFTVVYALCSTTFASPSWRKCLIGLQLLIAVGNLGLALYQAVGDPSYHPLPWLERENLRAGGLFEDSNHFAASLLFPACILGGILIGGRQKASLRTLAALGLGLCLGGFVLAVSRSGFLAASVGIFGLAVFAFWPRRVPKRHRWTAPLGVAAVALVLVLASFWVFQSGRASNLTEMAKAHALPKLGLWEPAWRQVVAEPIVGSGARTYEIFNRQHRPESLSAAVGEHTFAENDVLQLTAEYGWVGISLALICIGVHLSNGVQSVIRDLEKRRKSGGELAGTSLALTIGAICALLSILFLALLEAHLHVPSIAVMAAMSLAILANPTGQIRDPEEPERHPAAPGLTQVAAFVAGLLLLWNGHRYFQSDWRELRSDQLAEAGDITDSLLELQTARVLDPNDPFLHIREAELALEVHGANLDAAAEAYLEGYKLHPQNPRMLIALGEVLEELDRSDEATRYFEEAVYWAPTYGITRYAYASHLLRLGREADANIAFIWANEAPVYPWTAEVDHSSTP